jgi:hypothetical protein
MASRGSMSAMDRSPTPGRRRPLATKAQIVDELRRLASDGTPPLAEALLPGEFRLVRAAVRKFGTLAAARAAADLDDDRKVPVSRADVIKALRKLRDAGIDIGPERLHLLGEDAVAEAALRHWPDLHQARVAAGIIKMRRWQPEQGLPKRRRLAPPVAFAELREHAERLGRTPARHEVSKELARSVVSMFGGWEKGLIAAGLEPNRGRAPRPAPAPTRPASRPAPAPRRA